MEIKINYFESRGVKMKYFEMGEGTPIIFLHAVGVVAMTYKKLLNLLAKNYRVVAPDLPCFGGSSIPAEIWDFSDYSIFFNDFINSLNLENIILIGHSFGGGIALHLAGKSTKINKIFLADPAGEMRVESLLLSFPNFFIKKTIYDLFVNPIVLFAALRAFLFNVINKFSGLLIIFKIVIKTIRESPINLDQIKIPTLILWGKDEEIFPLSKTINMTDNNFVKIEYVDGNHDWILFHPEYLLKFL